MAKMRRNCKDIALDAILDTVDRMCTLWFPFIIVRSERKQKGIKPKGGVVSCSMNLIHVAISNLFAFLCI